MKHIAMLTLFLHLGVAAVYAQEMSVKMSFSGTSAPSAVNLLQPNTSNDEDNFAGNGTLGSFTFRQIRAISNSPAAVPPSTCSGPNLFFLPDLAGAGVFRFQDGSLLNVQLTQGGDCITPNEGRCTLTLQIAGGTGRFKNAAGTLTFTEIAVPVLFDASANPVLFDATGEFTGTVSGVVIDEERQT
jgi:hypothetical protein